MASIVKLPVFVDVPNWTAQVALDGQTHTIRAHWNAREGYWYLHLYDELGLSRRAVQKFIPVLDTGDTVEQLLVLAEADERRGDPPGTLARQLSLFPRFVPGLLWARAGVRQRQVMGDLTTAEILYFDAAAMSDLRAYAESVAA